VLAKLADNSKEG